MCIFFFKQKTAYEMRISDWSSDVCSSDLSEGTLTIAAIRDVTERRHLDREVQDLNERLTRDNAELAAVNNELEAFSYSVSHDLRAPLRAIDGLSQALLEDCADNLDPQGPHLPHRVRRGEGKRVV